MTCVKYVLNMKIYTFQLLSEEVLYPACLDTSNRSLILAQTLLMTYCRGIIPPPLVPYCDQNLSLWAGISIRVPSCSANTLFSWVLPFICSNLCPFLEQGRTQRIVYELLLKFLVHFKFSHSVLVLFLVGDITFRSWISVGEPAVLAFQRYGVSCEHFTLYFALYPILVVDNPQHSPNMWDTRDMPDIKLKMSHMSWFFMGH